MFEKLFHREAVDIKNLKIGDLIKIKQPAGKAYNTSADADLGYGGYEHSEKWIDTKIKAISLQEDDQYITTEDSIYVGSFFINEFSPDELWYENGILYAEEKYD